MQNCFVVTLDDRSDSTNEIVHMARVEMKIWSSRFGPRVAGGQVTAARSFPLIIIIIIIHKFI